MDVKIRFKGGPGSGHHGHAGRPGEQGGSLPSGEGGASTDNVDISKKPRTSRKYKPITYETDRSLYRRDLYNIKHGSYRPTRPIALWKVTGHTGSNYWYGSSNILKPMYEDDVATKNDVIEHLPGGIFLRKNGKGDRIPVKFIKPKEFAPFERYSQPSNALPIGAMKFIRN